MSGIGRKVASDFVVLLSLLGIGVPVSLGNGSGSQLGDLPSRSESFPTHDLQVDALCVDEVTIIFVVIPDVRADGRYLPGVARVSFATSIPPPQYLMKQTGAASLLIGNESFAQAGFAVHPADVVALRAYLPVAPCRECCGFGYNGGVAGAVLARLPAHWRPDTAPPSAMVLFAIR